MSTKPDPPTPEPPSPRRKWPLGATLVVPCAVMVLVLFFLPWHHVISDMGFGSPKLLFTVSGLDRARGFDMDGRVAAMLPGSYQQIGPAPRMPIRPVSLTRVDEGAPWLWIVPPGCVLLGVLAAVRILGRTGRPVSLAMLLIAAVLAGALFIEAGYRPEAAARTEVQQGVFHVFSDRHLAVHLAFAVAALAALCCGFDLAFPGPVKDFS